MRLPNRVTKILIAGMLLRRALFATPGLSNGSIDMRNVSESSRIPSESA